MQITSLYSDYFEEDKQDTAYSGEEEYWNDLFAMLDIVLSVAVLTKILKYGRGREIWMEQIPLRGVLLHAEELFQKYSVRDRAFDEFPAEDIASVIRKARFHILARLNHTDGKLSLRYPQLAEKMKFTEWEQFLFLLSFSVSYDEKYEIIFSYLQEDIRIPTLRLAISLYQFEKPLCEEERTAAIQRKGYLYRCFLSIADTAEYNPAAYAVQLDRRVCTYLLGRNEISEQMSEFVSVWSFTEPLEPICIRQAEQKQICQCMEGLFRQPEKRGKVFGLYGTGGIGKKYLLKAAAAECKKNLLFVDAGKLLVGTVEELRILFAGIMRESILFDAVLCFFGYEPPASENEKEFRENEPEGLRFLMSEIRSEYATVVWLSQKKADFLSYYRLHIIYQELPMLTAGERECLWREYSQKFLMGEDVDIQMLANQYIVSPRNIQEVLWDAQIHAAEKITAEDIRNAMNRQVSNQLGKLAPQIHSVYTWDDLVIHDEQKNQLKMICDQARYRTIVGEEWGFYKKAVYGRGICALFYGASGTGKTMAVQVIANELGLGLYRVDLSQIMSKYIGETQKNISDLFQRAENTNAVLFFDEADALFAKRSEVKDSRDRGANAETAYLLQRLEDYDGITILATNYINNIDEAFKRRIKFMIPFAFPTPEVRLKLWNTLLPQEALLGEELDFSFFAERFELSGSSIKEILTNAAFLAAAEGRGIYNRDLEEAIRLNFAKYGKILTEKDFAHRTKQEERAGEKTFSERESMQSKKMLTVNSFGRFRVTANSDGREFTWRTRKGRELFAYLLDIRGKPIERRRLLDILWREEMPGSSVAMLHNMIYNIRKELSVYQLETILVYDNKQYHLDMERISCDMTRIEELAQSVRQRRISELRENASSFLEYWGSYLEDIDSPWAEARRQYYDEIYIQGCFLLAEQFMEEEASEQAVLLYQNILTVSPYSEEAMKNLLLVYGRQKRWEKMKQSYQSFEEVLKRDLGIAPGKEVMEAYQSFLK